MRKARPTHRRSYVERLTTPGGCFFICMVGLTAAGGAFAQNARTPVPHSGATSPYVVDGLALGARVDFEVRHIVGTNAARANCFRTSRGASERKNSKREVLAALSKQPARLCTAGTGKRFISIAISPPGALIGTRFKMRSNNFRASSVSALARCGCPRVKESRLRSLQCGAKYS